MHWILLAGNGEVTMAIKPVTNTIEILKIKEVMECLYFFKTYCVLLNNVAKYPEKTLCIMLSWISKLYTDPKHKICY